MVKQLVQARIDNEATESELIRYKTMYVRAVRSGFRSILADRRIDATTVGTPSLSMSKIPIGLAISLRHRNQSKAILPAFIARPATGHS